MSMLKKFFAQKPKVEERKTRRGKLQEEEVKETTVLTETVQEEADNFDWENATKEEKAEKYKQDYALEDAQHLYEVLGNKEAVIRTIESQKIGGGKWEYLFIELYALLNKADKPSAKILKDAYFDIVKINDFSILWEGFPNHQELVRWENVREFVDLLTEYAKDFELNIEDVATELQRRVQKTKTEDKSASVAPTTVPQTTPTQPIAEQQEVEVKHQVVEAEKVASTPTEKEETKVIEAEFEEVPSKEGEKSEDYYESLTKEIFEPESETVA